MSTDNSFVFDNVFIGLVGMLQRDIWGGYYFLLVNFWVDIVSDGELVSVDMYVAEDMYVPSRISVGGRGVVNALLGFCRTWRTFWSVVLLVSNSCLWYKNSTERRHHIFWLSSMYVWMADVLRAGCVRIIISLSV